ncbi:MAG: hypothetical protein QXF26_03790 [Candidatus Bathyarchaeia archaeon]
MSDKKPCACMQNFTDLMRAATQKNDLLRKIVCSGCGKTVWVNRETKYCFDCETKLTKEAEPSSK